MKRIKCFFTLILCIPILCQAYGVAQRRISLEQISVDEGLPHTDVTAILQDSTGYIWIGTSAGLCRYDGMRFVNYNITNSILQCSRITCLHLDSDGLLYIGTETGGVTIYNTVRKNFVKTIPLSQTSVNCIFSDSVPGKEWICTDDGVGLLSLNGENHELTSWSLGYRVGGGCLAGKENSLVLATVRGLVLFDASKVARTYIGGSFTKVVPAGAGKYFGTSDAGCFLYDVRFEETVKLSDLPSLNVSLGRDGNLWVGTYSDGILCFALDFSLKSSYLPGRGESSFAERFNITSLFFDSSSVLWIGTIGNGCYKSNEYSRQFECYSLDTDAVRHPVSSLFADSSNRLWVAFRDGALAVMEDGKLVQLDQKSLGIFGGSPVSAIFETDDGNLWLGSWAHGTVVLSPDQMRAASSGRPFVVYRPSGIPQDISIFKFVRGSASDMWISTNKGACHVFKNGSPIEIYRHDASDEASVIDDFSTDILVDEREDTTIVWLGSRQGVTRFFCNSSTGEVEHIKRLYPSRLERNMYGEFVAFIHKSSAGEVWISTLGGGLNKLVGSPYDDKPAFSLYNDVNYDFPNNEFESLQEDSSGNFWLGGYGLTKFNPLSGEIAVYSKDDGLQSNVFKIWDSALFPDGRMAFGGIDGFNVFNPSAIKGNTVAPSVVLAGLKINGVETLYDDGKLMRLRHNMNNVTFDFAALHFESPSRNRYRYRLAGAEQDWHFTDGTAATANYLNLRPGKYNFEVYAANANGQWNSMPATLAFIIRPPFFLSWMAYLIYILLLALAVYALVNFYRTRSEHRHQLEIERNLRKEEQQRNENELKFQTEFLHEVKTPLTLIKTPVEELLQNVNLGKNTQGRLKLVLQSANILQKDIEAVTDLRKYDNGKISLHVVDVDFCRFVEEIALLFQPVAHSRGIELVVIVPEEGIRVFLDKDQMEKVILNLISNAVKYSPDRGGRISVEVAGEESHAVLKVSNLGMGILPEDIGNIFDRFVQGKNNHKGGMGIGLAISKYVVESHSGTISATSVLGGETVFTVTLPVGDGHFSPEDIDRDYSNSDQISNYDSLAEFAASEKTPVNIVERKYTVLIVDDNEGLMSYFEQLVSTRYNVITAKDGQKGYEKAIADQPDLVLTDVVMPGMNGLELCSKIKNNSDTAHIPVIIISARDLPVHKIEGYQMLADDYLTKPFHADVLLSRIDNLIQQRENMRNSFRKDVSLEPSAVTATPVDEKFVRKCIKEIEAHMSDADFGVEELCAEVGCSRPQLYRRIKYITGQSAIQFVRSVRLKRAAQLFSSDKSLSVSEVMAEVGFSNASYFSKIFYEEFGVLPKDYED